ncbi:Holliday junction branch migration protein RuvA [bacterium c-19]|nr:Holliday junction branch migration protein RuvA [bacterium c-19]
MIAFVKGTVCNCEKDCIIIENQGIGYRIYVANPLKFSCGDEATVYTYQYVREDALMLYGFSTTAEHDLFLRLISVKGVGPRTALGMLAVSDANEMIVAIEQNDVKYMKSLPGIGAKTAGQIILDLKGKLVETQSDDTLETDGTIKEALEALRSLGYKAGELQGIAKELSDAKLESTEAYIRHALGIMAKRKGV